MRLNGSVALHEVKLQIHLLNQFATAAKTTVCICKIYDPDLQFFLHDSNPFFAVRYGLIWLGFERIWHFSQLNLKDDDELIQIKNKQETADDLDTPQTEE